MSPKFQLYLNVGNIKVADYPFWVDPVITISISITKEMASPHISTMKSGKRGRKYVQTFFQVAGGQEQEESKTEQLRVYPQKVVQRLCFKQRFSSFPW